MQLNKSGNRRGMQGQMTIARKHCKFSYISKKDLEWRKRARENNTRIMKKYSS